MQPTEKAFETPLNANELGSLRKLLKFLKKSTEKAFFKILKNHPEKSSVKGFENFIKISQLQQWRKACEILLVKAFEKFLENLKPYPPTRFLKFLKKSRFIYPKTAFLKILKKISSIKFTKRGLSKCCEKFPIVALSESLWNSLKIQGL